MTVELTSSDVRVTLEGTEAESNLTVVRAPVTVEVVNATAGGGGGGVTDHGALTGLGDDDHLQYQRAESVFTTTSPFTITDESLVVTTGSAVTLPDSTAQTGRMVSIGAASVDVTISAAGSDTIHGVGATFTLPVGNGVTFVALSINGTTGWSIINRRGAATDLPEWYSQGIADGNLVTLQSGVPAWTTGTRTQYDFLSGTGWTYDVPVLVPVKNTTASTIAKGAPVYATGTVGATSTIEIAPADANVVSAMPAIGLTESSLAANATGFVTVVGTLRGLNTNAYSINQPLYVSTTAGELTGTKPTGTSDAIQMIALVTRVNSSNGEVLVLAQGSDEVPNAIDAGKITSGTLSNDRLDTELKALASTTSAADALPYFTGSGTATTTTLTSAGRALIDDADAAAQRTTLGLATIASSASASDLTTGTVASARLNTKVVGGQDEGSTLNEPATATSFLDSTITLPACAAGDLILVNAGFTFLQNSGGARTITFDMRLGSTTIMSVGLSVTQSAVTRSGQLVAAFRVEGTSDVNGSMHVVLNNISSPFVAHGVATENIGSGSLALDFRITGTNNATQQYQLQYLTVTRVAA
jgi:hypothetical protein